MTTDLRTYRRPDGRVVVWPTGQWTPEQGRWAMAFAHAHGVALITHLDAERVDERRVLNDAGFIETRREVTVEVDIDVALEAIGDAQLPAGVAAVSAADADPDRLRLLDDALRDDIPGTAGWRSTAQEFADDTFGDPDFDPKAYLVAVDESTGAYIGLVRVWMNPVRPRIGMFGVRRAHRRRGIALGLLAQCLRAAQTSGHRMITSEFDEENEASRGVFDRLRARQAGISIELATELPAHAVS